MNNFTYNLITGPEQIIKPDGSLSSSTYFRIPGIHQINSGRIISVFDIRYASASDITDGTTHIDIGMKYSDDNGETWSIAKVISHWTYTKDGKTQLGTGDPCITYDEKNNIIYVTSIGGMGLYYSSVVSDSSSATTSQFVQVFSTDNGNTWSTPTTLNPQIRATTEANKYSAIFSGPGRGIQLKNQPNTANNGRLVVPIQHWIKDNYNTSCSGIMISTGSGSGIRWVDQNVNGVGNTTQTQECQVEEMSNGDLLLIAKYQTSSSSREGLKFYKSTNLGASWSLFYTDEQLRTSNIWGAKACQASLLRVGSIYYLSYQNSNTTVTNADGTTNYGRTAGMRDNLTIKYCSEENLPLCKWETLTDVYPRNSNGYSCLAKMNDGTLLDMYESSKGLEGGQAINITKIKIEDFANTEFPNEVLNLGSTDICSNGILLEKETLCSDIVSAVDNVAGVGFLLKLSEFSKNPAETISEISIVPRSVEEATAQKSTYLSIFTEADVLIASSLNAVTPIIGEGYTTFKFNPINLVCSQKYKVLFTTTNINPTVANKVVNGYRCFGCPATVESLCLGGSGAPFGQYSPILKILTKTRRFINYSNILDKIDPLLIVDTKSSQTANGLKTFTSTPIIPTTFPTKENEVTNKKYVDKLNSDMTTALANEATLRQNADTKLTTDLTTSVSNLQNTINTLNVQNVKLSGTQTISGLKTFTVVPEIPTNLAINSTSQIVNKQYVDNAITTGTSGGVVYRGETTVTATSTGVVGPVKVGYMYVISSGTITVLGNIYTVGDYLISKVNNQASGGAITPDSFSWINSQDSDVVKLGNSQTISGIKTFTGTPIIQKAPVNQTDATNKQYVDSLNTATNTALTNEATLRQNADNKLSTDLSTAITNLRNNEITPLDAQNVKLSGVQTIAGAKTFTTLPIVQGTPVNPNDVVNKQYIDTLATVGGLTKLDTVGGTYTMGDIAVLLNKVIALLGVK